MYVDITEERLKELMVEVATEIFYKLQQKQASDAEDAAWAKKAFLATIGNIDDDDMQLIIT